MENEFVPYEQALALKELGFDEDCILCYHTKTNDNYNIKEGWLDIREFRNGANFNNSKKFKEFICSAPLYQQAFRWFREKYEFEFHIGCYRHTSVKYYQVYLDDVLGKHSYSFGKSFTYEEAELACLRKLIEIVKNK